MTDYPSVEELLVFRNDAHVAGLRRLPKGCEFRYTSEFLASEQPAIALHLPKTGEGLRLEGVANLPTYFAGLLPEGVMFSAVRRLIGAAADDLFALLAATGADAVGDIDTRVPGEEQRRPKINLAEAAEEIAMLLGGSRDFPAGHLAAIPGVQPKMSLGELVRASRAAAFIAKFDSPDFPRLIENESTFMRLAKLCRLDVPDTKLEPRALVVRRFDRRFDKSTNRMQRLHVEDMLQAMDLFPNSKYSMEYADLLRAMTDIGLSKAALLDALRLYVFSYIIGNGDLHAKNVSVAFDRGDQQWRLTPAYDLLSTLPYADVLPGADRMALALADESFGRFTVPEFVSFGGMFGLPEKAVTGMVHRTASSILKFLPRVGHGYLTSDVVAVIVGRAESLLGSEA